MFSFSFFVCSLVGDCIGMFYWFAWFRCRPSYSINYAMKEREERRKGIFVFASDTHTDADTQHLIRRGHTQSTKRCQMKLPVFSLLAAAGILCGYIFIWRWKKDKILPSCVYNNRDDGDHKSSSRNGGAISKRRIDANHFNSPKNTKKKKERNCCCCWKNIVNPFYFSFFFGMGRGTGCCISPPLSNSLNSTWWWWWVTIYCWIHIGRAR